MHIRLVATGNPMVASSWIITTSEASVANPQSTNGYTWYYGDDVT